MSREAAGHIRQRGEVADGMRIDWDAPVPVSDGTVLRADVFRPDDDEPHPVIMTLGPYAKGLAFQDGFTGMWQRLTSQYPDALARSSNRYQVRKTADPEKWVPDGYASIMERWIGSCRRELLDRTLVWNQRHLMTVLREYEDF